MTQRKNILLIGMDDAFSFWRFRKVFGAELKLPNLDRICAVSSAFHSAYCQVPVCGPSRASAMSALSPYETGVFDNYTNIFEVMRPEQMWQFRLKEEGYYCATAGKIHHGYKPLAPEIHNALYSHPARHVFFGPRLDAPHKRFGGRMGGAGTTDPAHDRQYYDYRSAQDAIRFLNSYDGPAPFYREVGFHHPHPPFRTPVRFKEMYDLDEFIQPQEWTQGFDLADFTAIFMQENMDAAAVDDWKRSIRNYFSAFSHVDAEIGRVWDALKASGHAENTIVVIFSDHGYHMGDKGRFRKFTLWEEATRVPFIVHDPTMPAQVIDTPVALVDMGPTILDYAGARPMVNAVGRSLRPLVEGRAQADRAVPTFWYGSVSVRTGDHRITLYQDGEAEFYDVVNDPWQTRNLAGSGPAYDAALRVLDRTCRDYGVVVVPEGAAADEAASFYSVHHMAAQPPRLATNGVVSVGSLAPMAGDPGYRKHFVTLDEDGTVAMAEGMREMLFASDANGGVQHFKVTCNDAGNRIFFAGGHDRFVLEVEGGAGGDDIYTAQERLVAWLGAGRNRVRAGNADGTVHGGRGVDTVYTVAGVNLVHGGQGNTEVFGGKGEDTIHTGHGRNTIHTGTGKTRVIVDGGENTIHAHEGTNTLIFLRTELPQVVEGFRAGIIDLSDWRVLGRVRAETSNAGIALTAGSERIWFPGAEAAVVIASVTGAEVED